MKAPSARADTPSPGVVLARPAGPGRATAVDPRRPLCGHAAAAGRVRGRCPCRTSYR